MKTLIKGLLCTLTLAGCLCAQAQDKGILALTGAADLEELDESEYERLEALAASPIPINSASLARLQSCGLFTRFQAASLMDYRSRSGDILSVSELALVDGFSRESAEALAPFLSLQATGKAGMPPGNLTHTDLLLRGEWRDGLIGYGLKGRVEKEGRFLLSATARTQAAACPGAPDTWSFNATRYFRKRSGKLIVGDFNARFGQGLALWNGFSLSSLTTVSSFARHPTGLSPAWSFSPDGPLRGMAADLDFRRLTVSAVAAFPGLRARMDGNPRAGLTSVGALNVHWTGRSAEVSATAMAGAPLLSGSKAVTPPSRIAADFRWTPGQLGWFGEAAVDLKSGALAGVGGLIWSPAYQKKVSVVARYYPLTFQPDMTGGVRAGTRCCGESGVAAGLQLPWLRFTADYARFPAKAYAQLKILASAPLRFREMYSLTPRLQLRWREGRLRQDYRLEAALDRLPWLIKLRMDAVRCVGTAWQTYAETGRKTERFSIYARAGLFKVDDWEDRIYVYERDTPGSFNVPARYGRGYNASLVAGLRWKRHRLYLRIGGIRYVTDKPGRSECRLQYALDI